LRTKNEQESVRGKIRQLLSRGKTQRQISEIMKISLDKTDTIVQPLKKESKVNIQKYVNEEQSAQYEITGLSQIIDLTWASTDKASNEINISNIKLFNYSETN
jgi:ArsR family metal-binding transcriptional regulator